MTYLEGEMGINTYLEGDIVRGGDLVGHWVEQHREHLKNTLILTHFHILPI